MPVFHTKTIESILEPVAQQVSRLVILHEEAEDGNAMPDLAMPVQTVKLAVNNLVKVGYDTINNSEDANLKMDMPPALQRVEEASILLLQASDMLRVDPFSAPARKKLIEGSRGILQGTSALLLAFDESEVRKITRICKNVLEYLAITEVVETMDDLVTFVRNLSPVLTKMTKDVDSREKELTHQVHREWLQRSIDQIRQLTPILISGVKMYITTKAEGEQGLAEAEANRNYVVGKVSNEIHEMIRVLQLTTYDEEEWEADDITIMKKAQNAMQGKLKNAQKWLQNPAALVGGSDERALKQILDDALKIADRCPHTEQRESVVKAVSDIQSMSDGLTELRSQGQGNSPQALALAKGIQQKLEELTGTCSRAVAATERSGVQRPAHTMAGKVEQAQRWLNDPGMHDKGLGEEATRLVSAEARQIAMGLPEARRKVLMKLCDEVEGLTNQLSDLCHKNMGDSAHARAVAANLSQKLHQLKGITQDTLVSQVADEYIDIVTPLKQLASAATAPFGTPNREGAFSHCSANFSQHAKRLADAASRIALAGGCRNRHTIEAIQSRATEMDELTPQIVKAASIVLANPSNPASLEHFDLLKKQWLDNAEDLRKLVDEATDTAAFIKAQEEGILGDTENVESSIKAHDPQGVVNGASSIARRANRVLQVAQQEAENSEDPKFVDHVNGSIHQLGATITPMVQNAKGVAQNPANLGACDNWRATNNDLIDSVSGVRKAIAPQDFLPPPPNFPPPPDLSQLAISVNEPYVPQRPANQQRIATASVQIQQRSPGPISPHSPELDKIATDLEHLQRSMDSVPAHIYRQRQQVPEVPPPPVLAPPSEDAMNGLMGPPIPPPPLEADYHYRSENAPPRPPLPYDSAPPRPPPPETDDEDEITSFNFPAPQANQPIMMAAHALHMDVKEWSSQDNELIGAAKKMAKLMANLSMLVRGEGGTKRDLIDTARCIAQASEEVTKLAKKLANECTDKRMKISLLQVCERIPTIGTQLKILSTVKATMLGAQGSEEDLEATEMLVGNAQNLMQSVRETVRAAEAASIKIRVDSGYSIRWVRKRPWYT